MPSRDASRPQRVARVARISEEEEEQPKSARAPKAVAKETPNKAPIEGDDTWDTISEMKGGSGGDGGFNKMNTSFFLRDEEEAEVVFIDEQPTIFFGHNIKCESDAGKTFYRTEACQKSEHDHCTMCDSTNPAIGKANRVIAFRLLDSRGSWDSKSKSLDGVPAPKIFLVPLYLAKQIKGLKDDAGEISDKIVKLTKNGQYVANFKMTKLRSGGFDYESADEEIFEGLELPEILEVYAPLEDEDLIDFIDKFGASAQKKAPASTGRAVGGFGKR